VIWFLRLFSHFRALESEAQRNVRLQDTVQDLTGQLDWLRSLVTEAQTNERRAYQMLVNFETQGKIGVCPFPDAPKMPPAVMDRMAREPIELDSVRGYDMVARETRKFFEQARTKD
jgi:hypothetical protein